MEVVLPRAEIVEVAAAAAAAEVVVAVEVEVEDVKWTLNTSIHSLSLFIISCIYLTYTAKGGRYKSMMELICFGNTLNILTCYGRMYCY